MLGVMALSAVGCSSHNSKPTAADIRAALAPPPPHLTGAALAHALKRQKEGMAGMADQRRMAAEMLSQRPAGGPSPTAPPPGQ